MNGAPFGLGKLERMVMQLMWANDHLTVNAVRELLGESSARRPKESTVRTVLRRLEEKGFVAHTVDRRSFVYRATEPRRCVAAKAVKRLVDWFCNGSLDEVLAGMVESAMLDRRQLQILIEKIEGKPRERGDVDVATRIGTLVRSARSDHAARNEIPADAQLACQDDGLESGAGRL